MLERCSMSVGCTGKRGWLQKGNWVREPLRYKGKRPLQEVNREDSS